MAYFTYHNINPEEVKWNLDLGSIFMKPWIKMINAPVKKVQMWYNFNWNMKICHKCADVLTSQQGQTIV